MLNYIAGRLTSVGIARVIVLSINNSTENPTCEYPAIIFLNIESQHRTLQI
jgi:hypothetical protein